MLPRNFPKWQSVYKYVRKWREDGHIKHFIEKTIMRIRRKRKQNECPTVGTLDAQSVKWSDRHSHNGFDANKKEKGLKRNIVVDCNSFIHCRTVDNAGRHDSKLAYQLCKQTSFFCPTLKKTLVDRGYRGEIADQVNSDFMIELEVSNTSNGTKGGTPKPLRWVMERIFAWLDGLRRLTRNY